MKPTHIIALTLLIVGGLNWGLVGLFGFDLVAALFGSMSIVSRVVYIGVGVAAVVELAALFRPAKRPEPVRVRA